MTPTPKPSAKGRAVRKPRPEWHTLCVECGPNVQIDDDGTCSFCGATACGAWLSRNGVVLAALDAQRPAGKRKPARTKGGGA